MAMYDQIVEVLVRAAVRERSAARAARPGSLRGQRARVQLPPKLEDFFVGIVSLRR